MKPIDESLIRKLAKSSKAIITVEENILAGGVGSCIREFLADEKINIFSIGIPDEFVEYGNQEKIREIYNLSDERLYIIFRQLHLNFT